MIAWVRRLMGLAPPPEKTPEDTEVRHKATLKRADRLLERVEDYRAADRRRRRE